MSKSLVVILLSLLSANTVAQDTVVQDAIAQDAAEISDPAIGHQFLKMFVGSWVAESKCTMAPGAEPIDCQSKIQGKMLGEFWVQNTMESSIGGTRFTAVHTVGYDAAKKKYVATWIDSTSDLMWKYDGTLTGNKLVFEAEGPDFMNPGLTKKFRDTYDFAADGKLRLKSESFGNGKWTAFMTGTATRQ
ncbi:MAG: DUF1579 domain-containing protein [Fuerstiella sp.]